jgi:glycosyltransferase involved in cell wall biosynthesis
MLQPGISIVICTYNGTSRLSNTLKALAELDVTSVPSVELLLVDNASTDNTTSFVQSHWETLGTPYPLTILQETNPGKINAQNLALSQIKHSYALICDDDNALFPDYLLKGYELLTSHSQIGALGGRGIVQSEVPIPDWFESMAYMYACAPQAERTGDVRPTRNVIYGAGMFLNMTAYQQALQKGFTFLLPSRTGTSVVTGAEDGEICWWLRFSGFEIWYAEELKFHHQISPSRLTDEYHKKLLTMFRVGYPVGKLYLRIFNGELKKPIRFFWLKEFVYTLLAFVQLPFQNIPEKNLEYKRCIGQMTYFLKHGKRYNEAFRKLLKIYQSVHHG